MPFCRHDTWMQHRQVTHKCCIYASCWAYGVDTLPKGQHDAPMQQQQVTCWHCLGASWRCLCYLLMLHSCIMQTKGHSALKHYAALNGLRVCVHVNNDISGCRLTMSSCNNSLYTHFYWLCYLIIDPCSPHTTLPNCHHARYALKTF